MDLSLELQLVVSCLFSRADNVRIEAPAIKPSVEGPVPASYLCVGS